MFTLYPAIECRAAYTLPTKTAHTVYFEESGNPAGTPALFLHGGPGSGCKDDHRRYFNPERYRIILFDQRGCGRSVPNGEIRGNTTGDILDDIEAIRQTLGIERWLLFGGSWGATLALLYAERFPRRVSGMVLRGIFLARQCDIDWFMKSGVNRLFPDYWEEFIGLFSEDEREDLPSALHQRVFCGSAETQLATARAWALWAGRVVTHTITDNYLLDETDNDETLINRGKIEIHYAKNGYFIAENEILERLSEIPDVPITIIHGRLDMTCLPSCAWLTYQGLLNLKRTAVRQRFIPGVGHLASEAAMVDALVEATERMSALL